MKTKRICLLIIAACILHTLTACTGNMTVGADGKPIYTLGLDSVAAAQMLAAWQTKHGAKGATVYIIGPDNKPVPALPPAPAP